MNFKRIKFCRICKSRYLYEYLDLGDQPLSNSFLRKKDINNEKKFPLKILFCKKCYLSQLSIVVNPKLMFTDYDYLSSSSHALKIHYKNLVRYMEKKFHLLKDDLMVDIGCNDGILLNNFSSNFKNLVGVEPSNASNYITDKRIILYNNFFSKKISLKIKKDFKKAKIISMTNVFAHVHEINLLLKNIRALLLEDGVFVIEVPYLFDMLKKGLFDVIYHEHLSYFSAHSLLKLLKKNYLKIIDIKKINFGASGPALRVFISHEKNKFKQNDNLEKILNLEKQNGISKLITYKKFNEKVKLIKENTKSKIYRLKQKGNQIACYTAPAKGNTFLNYLSLKKGTIMCVSENNKKKIGKFTPGTHIKIVDDNYLIKNKIKYAILLSWNYKKFFLRKSKFIKNGGKFIIPF